mgnify:CR=1 FL=1
MNENIQRFLIIFEDCGFDRTVSYGSAGSREYELRRKAADMGENGKQKTENGKRKTENGETGNGKTGNGKRKTGNGMLTIQD